MRCFASTAVRVIVPAAAALVVTFIVTMLAILPYAQAMGQRVVDRINEDPDRTSLVAMLGLAVLPIFVVLFFGAAVWASVTAFVADGVTQGRPTSLARSAGASVRRLPTVIVILFAWLLAGVAAVLAAPVFVVVGLLGLLATPVVRRTSLAGRWPSWQVFAVLAVPFAVAIVGVIRTAFAAPAALLDGLGVRAAVRRGWECTSGSVVGPALVLLLVACISFGANAFSVWLFAGFDGSDGVRVAVQFVVQLLVSPLPIVALVVMYRAEAPGASVPADGLDTQPLPGSGTRQVAVASAVAIALQLVVLVPSAGLTIAAPVAPASANAPCVVAYVYPDSSGVFRECGVDGDPAEVAANTEVTLSGAAGYNPDDPSEEIPTGVLILKVDGTEVGQLVLDGTFQESPIGIQYKFAAGTYTVTASYEPDEFSSYDAGSHSITVVAGYESTTTVTAPITTITFGNDVTIAADVASASGTPTGEVRFTGVPGGPIDVAVVGGHAEVTTSQLPPGTTTISADYSVGSTGGDHRPSSGSTTVTVEAAQTTTELTTAPVSPSAAGANVTARVVVAAQGTSAFAAGTVTVTLLESQTPLGSAPINEGVATFDLALAPGTHSLKAVFVPDPGFMTSFDSASHIVSKFASTVAITASSASSVVGESVTLTAQIPVSAGFVPTGIVDFYPVTGGDVGYKLVSDTLDANGDTTVTVPTMAVGAYKFLARYRGDDNFVAAESAPIAHSVGLAPVAILTVVQTTDPVVGSPIYVSVTVTPEASVTLRGQVTLTANDVDVARSQSGSVANQFTFTPTTAGPVELKATYSGNSEFAAKTDTSNITVGKGPVTVTMSNPASLEVTYGDTVIIAGAVSSGISTVPTGTVSLSANNRPLGQTQVDSAGQFSFSTNLVHAGDSIELVASYSGDNSFEPASNRLTPVRIKVGKATANPVTTTDAIAPAIGDTVAVNVDFDDVGAGATGTVTFLTPQNRVLGTAAVVAGMASLDLTLTDTTTWIIARYNGDNNFTQQDATSIRIDATRAASAVAIDDPGPLHYGDVTTLRARVTIPPGVASGGTVTFHQGQNRVLAENVPVVNGVASVAVCGGHDSFMSAEQQVQLARTCPAGNARLVRGTYELRATFSGNPSVNGSSTTRDITVAMASTRVELVASSSNPPYGSVLRLVATVTSTTSNAVPTTVGKDEEIEFISGKDSSGSGIRLGSAPLVNGVATLEIIADTRLHIDADRVVAIFRGKYRTFLSSEGETPVVLDRREVELRLYVKPSATGQQPVADGTSSVEVSIRSIVPGNPEPFTGTVSVSTADGATCSATFDVGEKRTECQIQWKSVGLQTVTASYSGDAVHDPGVSAPFAYTYVAVSQSSASQIVRVPTSVVENTTFPIRWSFNPSLTGTITVLGQPNCVDVPVSAGTCSARLDRTAVGAIDNLMRIQYSGDDNWLAHQFEFPIVVRGCYAVEVESSNPTAGSVSIDPPTNCATDTSTGYLTNTTVVITAVANESFEFVRWVGYGAASDSTVTYIRVTARSESLSANFQRSCYRVSAVPTRDETNQVSTTGRVTVEQSTLPNTIGYRDRRCDLVGGGVGFEMGTELSVRAVAELNPKYGEHDLFYGFGTAPTGAVRSGSDDHREGTLDFVVDGPLAIPAIFGPRCRVVSTSVDPADETVAAVDIVTPLNCESPFGDGFRLGGDQPSVTLSFVNTDDELFLVGWTVNGELGRTVNGEWLTVLVEPVVPIGDDDLDIVARVVRCQTVRVIVDGANSPDQLDGTDVTREEAAGTAAIVTEPNCPDGSNRYIVGVEVTVEAQHVDPDAVVTWSDNVAVALDTPTTGTIVVEADNEIVASFYLRSVCSLLVIDDPFDLVDLYQKTGCGPGYYLDWAKVYSLRSRDELARIREDRSSYADSESFESALASRASSFQTTLPIWVRTPPVGTYVGSIIGGRSGRPCFPVRCRREPVTGDVFITVSVCQTLVPNFSIRIKDDPLKTVYTSSTVPASTLAFDARGVASERPLAPWLETTDLSSRLQFDDFGQFIGSELSACDSFDNTFPPDTRVAARVGVSLPGLYVESWSGGTSFLPVPSMFGFEYQADVTTTGTPAQGLSVNMIAECKIVVVGVGVTVEPPPNCPNGDPYSYIVGTALSVEAYRYEDRPHRVSSLTQKWYEFTDVIDESVSLVSSDVGDDGRINDYWTGLAFVDTHLTIEAKYRSEADEDMSTAIRITKFGVGVLLAAGPALVLTVACPVCGAVIGGLAVAAFFVDLIPGTGGKASALINLINPATLFTCGSKWATNKPSPGVDSPPPGESPPETVSDQIAIDFDARIIELIEFAEDTSITDPDALELRTDMLKKTFEALADNVSIDAPTFDVDDARYAAKAAKVLNTMRKEYPTAKAFVSAFRPTAVAEVSSSFKDGVRAAKQTDRWTKLYGNGGPDAKASFMAAAGFAMNLNDAGYFDMDELGRNNGTYQDATEVAGLDNFTDCLKGKVGAITG